ncbi:MAG: hypothetical protein OEV21_05200 [Thermoplasmata archaeon]|nr:hypothetical protein [Thermoplasmata archaeon]
MQVAGKEVKLLVSRGIIVVILATLLSLSIILLEPNFPPDSQRIPWPNYQNDLLREFSFGSIETFSDISTGAHGNYSYRNLELFACQHAEAVVLDGSLWIMMNNNNSESEIARYKVDNSLEKFEWNLSFEAYVPKENSALSLASQPVGEFTLLAYLKDEYGMKMAGVALSIGYPSGEYLAFFNPSNGGWTNVSNDVLPAFPNNFERTGFLPDRYIISFEQRPDGQLRAMIYHTAAGLISEIKIPIINISSNPKLSFCVKSHTDRSQAGGWFLDNILFRTAESRYTAIGPSYEFISEGESVWIEIKDLSGNSIPYAQVLIDNQKAVYDSTNQKYSSRLEGIIGWDEKISCEVRIGNLPINETLRATRENDLDSAAIERWWNGWDWVTIFGRDDCDSPDDAIKAYQGYEHPMTAYMIGGKGKSEMILSTQSEMALHHPHYTSELSYYFWENSLQVAFAGQASMENMYSYASKWDNPDYVGDGDTYISMAVPGNSASYQYLYATYLNGIRINGICSNPLGSSAGNASLIGSWWPTLTNDGSETISSPKKPIDLMDSFRLLAPPESNPSWTDVHRIAEAGGALRLYTHEERVGNQTLLQWMDDVKTNFSFENWKATDGEIVSYIYGSWTTDIDHNITASNQNRLAFDVSRQDPRSEGYWLVPVTISVDVAGKAIENIAVMDGTGSYKASDGSLRNLSCARIMDIGFDLRDNILYVSHFWNESSKLIIDFMDTDSSSETVFIVNVEKVPPEYELVNVDLPFPNHSLLYRQLISSVIDPDP